MTGWYKFRIKGAGGGGSGAYITGSGGGGGGEGGTTIAFEKLKKGTVVPLTIGQGGSGGAPSYSATSNEGNGGNGEDSKAIINENVYIGGGGFGGGCMYNGYYMKGVSGGTGGSGTIQGAPGNGGTLIHNSGYGFFGGSGGGRGGGKPIAPHRPTGERHYGIQGGGGSGGSGSTPNNFYNGYKGGDGVIWIEYFDPKKK